MFTIRELCKKSGLSRTALLYYESIGLLILSGGYMARKAVKAKIAMSEIWEIVEERKELISYRKLKGD